MKNFVLFLKNLPHRWEQVGCVFKKSSLIELCFYLEQFLKAGWPLIDSLREVIVLLPGLKKPLDQSIHLIEKGVGFSVALEEFPLLFNHFFRSCIATYEKMGNLAEGFKELGGYLKWKKDFNYQLVQALLYPFLSLGLLLISAMILYTFFVPELMIFLEHMDQEMPRFTKIVLKILQYLGYTIKLGAIMGAFTVILIKTACRFNGAFRLIWDKIIYKIPYVGGMKKKQDIIHFLKIIDLFHRQGIDIVMAVNAAVRGINNDYFRYLGEKIIENLLKGQGFSQAIQTQNFMPPLITKILRTGEKTNHFSASFQMIFYLYEQALNKEKFVLVTLLQPCLLLLSGILLGGLFYAIFSPLYSVMGGIM